MKPNPSRRVLISGFEIGGQMQLLAETMRRRWVEATAAAFNDDFRGYQCDVKVGQQGSRFRRGLDQFCFFLWAIFHYDVFHFFWGVSLLSVWRFHLVDLPILKLLGKKVVVHFRGLDVVNVAYFDWLRETARGETVERPPMSKPDQLAKLRKWQKYADLLLVSEPDLHEIVPNAVLSPQVIDLSYWQPTREPLSRQDGVVRFVHAPSSRRKKGTDFIENSIRELQARGRKVELVLAEKLPHHKIKELYELSDIGIDQVLYGWHGKVSVELMALGRPVVCYIAPEFRKYRPDLPIVSAGPKDLTAVLEALVDDVERRNELGRKSREYVAKYHDVEVVVSDLFQAFGFEKSTYTKDAVPDAKMW